MPIYQFEGQHYDIATTDQGEAKSKILAHLGRRADIGAPGEEEAGLLRRGKAALGGLEFGASMASKIPQAIWSGYSGMGALITGQDPDKAMERAREQVPGYEPQSEMGKAAGEALEFARGKVGDLGGDSPALRSANEFAFDVATMAVPLGPRARTSTPKGPPGVGKLIAEAERRSKEPTLKEEPTFRDDPVQQELPFRDVLEEQRRAAEAERQYLLEEQQRLSEEGGQLDMFDPYKVTPKDLVDATKARKIKETTETIPYEDARLDPGLEEARIESMRENTRINEARDDRPSIDFPMRQEALERDPRLYDLRDKYENAKTEQAREAAIAEASRILKEEYNVTTPDQYRGSMWLDEPKALKIEKTERPSLGDPYKGPGKGQVGAIKLRDPAFERFKAKLPLPMRKYARQYYKEYQKQQGEKQGTVYENEGATKTLDNIPALRNWKDEIAPIPVDVPTILEKALKDEDLGSGLGARTARQLGAGGKMLGMKTQNTLVRFVVQQMDNAIREATRSIEELILDKNTGFKAKWEKLSNDDVASVWHTLSEVEGITDLTREALFEKGFSEKMVDAAMSFREALDKVYERVNAIRIAAGKKPLDKRLGYIPSRFRGDWTIEVRDIEGNLVHLVGAATKDGGKRLLERLKADHPEYKYGDVEHQPIHRFKDASDATAGYQSLLEVLAENDPRIEALESTYADFLKKQSYEAMSVRKHFWNKKGVGGFEGGKIWEDALTNAKEGLRSTMNYIDHAMKWAEIQEAMKPVREVMKDERIQSSQPEAVKWSQAYTDQAQGRSTDLARAVDRVVVDTIAKTTGIGQSLQLKGIRELKHFGTALALGFWDIGFSFSQMVQVGQTIPGWMLMFKNKGAESSLLASYAAGAIDTIKVFTPSLSHRLSPLSKEAMKHADRYAIVKPHILDEVRSSIDRQVRGIEDLVMTRNMTAFEHGARTMAYLSWVHFLRQTGQFKAGRELFETAANLTDMTMVDYRQHERAWLYKNMGVIGEMSNALTTYKHNYFDQMATLNAHRKGVLNKAGQPTSTPSGVGPLVAMLGTGLILSGLLGLPGRDDVDAVIRLLNFISPERIPTTRELALKTPDWMAFGGLSALTGMDLSGKFSTSNIMPDSATAFIQPFAGMVEDVGGSAIDALRNPSKTSAMRFAAKNAPGITRLPAEEYFTRKGADKKDYFIDPDRMEGKVARGTKERVGRAIDIRSLEESKAMHKSRNLKDQEMFLTEKRSAILKKAKDALFENNREHLKELAKQYVYREGQPIEFISELMVNKRNQNMTALTRQLIEAMNNAQKLKRIKEQVK